MNLILSFFISVSLLFVTLESVAQGCSDAGFCTLGALRPNQPFSKKINLKLRSVEITNYFGITQPNPDISTSRVYIYNVAADINISISNKITGQIKLPYQFVHGSLTNTNGLGDVSLSGNYNIIAKEKFQLNVSLGMKIPTSDANKSKNVTFSDGSIKQIALPMYYQTSLGTWDILGGISCMTKNWLFATGFQQVLSETPNQFLWTSYRNSADFTKSLNYLKSNRLIRGTDVMLRIERNFRFSNWNFYAGLLGIYRITKDKFFDPPQNKFVEIGGSDGLALTGLVGGGYRFDTHSGIKAMFGYNLKDRVGQQNRSGSPDIVLHKNPDGLSRQMVFTLGYEYRF